MQAIEIFLTVMDGHVLVEVSLLGEAHSTVWNWACVGFLICVNSQVVEEIMPLSKNLVFTVFMGASKHSNNLPGVMRRSVLINDKVICVWHVFVYSNFVQVEIFSLHYHNFCWLWMFFFWQLVSFRLRKIFQKVKTISLQSFLNTNLDKLVSLLDLLQRINFHFFCIGSLRINLRCLKLLNFFVMQIVSLILF